MFNRRTLAIIKRELKTKLFSKSFIIMTLLVPLSMILVFSIQFFIRDLDHTYETLGKLGIKFIEPPKKFDETGIFERACFETPNGMSVILWGMKEISKIAEQ